MCMSSPSAPAPPPPAPPPPPPLPPTDMAPKAPALNERAGASASESNTRRTAANGRNSLVIPLVANSGGSGLAIPT